MVAGLIAASLVAASCSSSVRPAAGRAEIHAGASGRATTKETPNRARRCVAVDGISELTTLAAGTGTSYDCALVYANRTTTWAEWTDPWILTTPDADARWAQWVGARPGRRLVLVIGLAPTHVPRNWRQLGAGGAYDGDAAALGRTLVSAGLGNSFIELAPESNVRRSGVSSAGVTVSDMRYWAQMWARMASAMRVPGSHFELTWTVNASYRDVPFADYYPGDRAVDVIGIDQYDSLVDGEAVPDGDRRWDLLAAQAAGLSDLERFAVAHHKPLAVPEWGLVSASTPGGGGDDGNYVRHMAAVFRTLPVRYESLFDVTNPGILSLVTAPTALHAYRSELGG